MVLPKETTTNKILIGLCGILLSILGFFGKATIDRMDETNEQLVEIKIELQTFKALGEHVNRIQAHVDALEDRERKRLEGQ